MNSWFVICGHALQQMLERAHAGEDPSLLLLEIVANSETEEVPGAEGT